MTDEEKDKLWKEVEEVIYQCISDVSAILNRLDPDEKENLYEKLRQLTQDSISTTLPQKLH
jgi:hypothetical protein